MSEHVVRVVRNGVDCLYIVNDMTVNDGILSFSIGTDMYVYKYSIETYSYLGDKTIVDCRKLKLLDIIDIKEVKK